MKKTFYSELAYIFGIIFLAIGTAFMQRADLGLSMIVAPAYLLHLKISKYLPFFSFGMAEYVFQAFLIILLVIILRKFKISYLFSFVTAVLYGLLLDGAIFLINFLPTSTLAFKILYFTIGFVICTASISLLFHTYISPEAYELIVKEISAKHSFDVHKVKIFYDLISLIVSVILSFAFFGLWNFKGISWGTLVTALLNGPLISLFSKFFERFFIFSDKLPLRKYFQTVNEEQ